MVLAKRIIIQCLIFNNSHINFSIKEGVSKCTPSVFYAQSPDFHNRATASKFSKIVINMQSFLQIIYHSITTEVVSVDIQLLQAMIQDVFLYHSSITPKTLSRPDFG